MKKNKLRIYLDTSVFGGVFDKEWEVPSKRLFASIKAGDFSVVTSPVVGLEIESSPPEVKKFYLEISQREIEIINISDSIYSLREAYIKEGFVRKKSANDALHVAIATVAGVDAIVSWNFKDIVRLEKIQAYNQVNIFKGYQKLTIITPKEAVPDEKA